ncbi:DUF6160 family protein [Venatoribacter cucullus]|uniref:DUF6160 family protein n=1 Tax=Venatoribacter cucullus TaxID=2661630 RepID=UPI00223EC3CB|nr:DUF6160 family protein [Venatoribacter cucullus]UZK03042.1 hypothetical protein GAY96_03530 [Venatoribacter cucullus]
MKKICLWAGLPLLLSSPLLNAMQVLDDAGMAEISGQSGITIELTTSDPEGRLVRTGEIRFTEQDNDGEGEDYLSIGGLTLRSLVTDNNGNVTGVDTIKTTIDVDAGGNVSIKSKDINTLDLELGEISFSGRAMFGGVRLSVWQFIGDSYLETALLNDPSGSKIAFRTVMEAGSGLTYQFDEDGVTFSSDVVFTPATGETAFRSEMFLTGDNDGLKLQVGEMVGTIEIQNISILDENGNNIFGANNFGDVGFGDISVNPAVSYFTLSASKDPSRDGIEGKFSSDMNIGTVFYRTGGERLNARNVQLNTNGELSYRMDFTDNGFITGLEASISDINDLDLIIGALTLSSGDGSNESLSMGSYAIENMNVTKAGNQPGSVNLGVYTMPGSGAQGMQIDLSIDGTASFDLTIKDDPAKVAGNPDPQLTAEIVMNNVSLSQSIDQTKKGLHIGVVDASMDMNINAIKMGDGQTYQGQTGRLVMNNMTLQPGSYFRIEPLQ